jgi:hypothetical protein
MMARRRASIAAMRRPQIVRVILILLLGILITVNLALAIPPFLHLGVRGYADYIAFYAGGRIIADHQGRLLYSLGAQMSVQRQLVGFSNPLLPYTHLPFEALLFATLVWLPFGASLCVWLAVNAVLLVGFAHAIRPFIAAGAPRATGLLVSIGLAFWPVMFCLNHGQDSILELVFFTLVFVSLKRGRDFSAGCWLALAMIKWQYVLPVLLLVIAKKQWKAVGGFAAAGAALAAVSLWLTWPTGPSDYLRLVRQYSGTWDQFYAMPSLYGLVSMWAHGRAGQVIAAALSMVAMVLPAISARLGAARDRAFDLQFSLAITAAVLAGYHVYTHDLSLLLLPLLLVAGMLYEQRRWPALASLGFFLLIQFYWGYVPDAQLAYVAIPIIAFAGLVWRMTRTQQA